MAKNKPTVPVYQELLGKLQKPLLKRFNDKVEKNRELAALILREMFTRVHDLTFAVPYLIPILVDRLNAYNLEGTDGMDEKHIPAPSQKPHVMVDPPESSEEVRVILAEITTIVIATTDFNCLRPYVDDIVNICRALCMDPHGSVIIEGCSSMNALGECAGD